MRLSTFFIDEVYLEGAKCRKCGREGRDFKAEYKKEWMYVKNPKTEFLSYLPNECIKRTCPQCGYTWGQKVLE